jgi:uncharacterized repeat protein (TIGR03847 family)
MADLEIELNPADFLTIGTVGPKGQRVFYLQAASGAVLVSLIIEKEQARALGEAIEELLQDLDARFPAPRGLPASDNMELREPITPRFRVAQMGLGYDEDRDMIVLVAQALATSDALADDEDDEDSETISFEEFEAVEDDEGDEGEGRLEASVTRIWCSRALLAALGERASQMVASGRPDPRQNGRLIYYWT